MVNRESDGIRHRYRGSFSGHWAINDPQCLILSSKVLFCNAVSVLEVIDFFCDKTNVDAVEKN